jgi:hypothetical protein
MASVIPASEYGVKSQDLDSLRSLIIRTIKVDYLDYLLKSRVIKGIDQRLGGVIEYLRGKIIPEILKVCPCKSTGLNRKDSWIVQKSR